MKRKRITPEDQEAVDAALLAETDRRRARRAMKAMKTNPSRIRTVKQILADEAAALAEQGDGALAQQDQFAALYLGGAAARQFHNACSLRNPELARDAIRCKS